MPMRVVTFTLAPFTRALLKNWIKKLNHSHVLSVTTSNASDSQTSVKTSSVKTLVTSDLVGVATPAVAALKPDLIISCSFPRKIPAELCSLPTFGAINIHPTVLPAYRGLNATRQFYDGWPEFGATAHWMTQEYDAGNILYQASLPMPKQITRASILPKWLSMIGKAVKEGARAAANQEIGTKQKDADACEAPPYSEGERWLSLEEPAVVIQRKATALNLSGKNRARVRIGNDTHLVSSVQILEKPVSNFSVNSHIKFGQDSMVIQLASGCFIKLFTC